VGHRVPLIDGFSKVTGSATYTDDIRMPGMLVGKILRSPHAHARIVSIDASRAEAIPGVHAIVTGDPDMAKFGVLPISKDEVALAVGRVKYVGDCVAGVAADTEETALEALAAIRVEYESLRVFDKPEDSLQEIEASLKINPATRHTSNLHKEVG
jgi:4-hydroxybenzoyl-CoA reductase subunit alpha